MAAHGRQPVRRRWRPLERELRESIGPHIAGVDEVGRGPLAGPVVACAVIMPPDVRAIRGVDDSKRLVAAQRSMLAARIRERAVSWALGAASVREIERLNIYHATTLAMSRALGRLAVRPDHVIIDGRPIRALDVPHTAVVGGDGCCYSVACASILAKVARDRAMAALARRYPAYRWERNVGYATPAHLGGLMEHGLTPHHRRTFMRVRQVAEGADASGKPGTAPGGLVFEVDLLRAAIADADQIADSAGTGDARTTDADEFAAAEASDLYDVLVDLRQGRL
ncbi:MAG TPA: ribonuclease HII [Gemmatimonadaceae bacterium]|nr:ribonuclease HII [Gemmatimonadaceae bacterium]